MNTIYNNQESFPTPSSSSEVVFWDKVYNKFFVKESGGEFNIDQYITEDLPNPDEVTLSMEDYIKFQEMIKDWEMKKYPELFI